MTIDRPIVRWLGGAAAALGGWAAIMLAMPFVGPPDRLVAIWGDDPATIALVVASGGRIVEVKEGVTLARGGGGFAQSLYRHGAPLVLEGRIAAGCFTRKAA